ncbi:alanine:cation symporter family protein [Wolbachia endosymbiont of Dirofilaria (Dirofilaria) immitis]|uniref:alanine:cation symporter family protein n=1 Tax=Wolbachia endosymbiont of Dirofilaria (Dirofilaria) immitis TaxID=1812115 RepID=UPI00158D3BA9|nr:alanine:cation symporter family protein [Wolbachia endosymbiont of Dirofilaria (Dirofilaria) immitis]QKX02375.1 sodium:alanine symporter family protein [Wolbachia endosymbiont of Dirofilaria (Dirofilaria) immitis]
MDTVKFVLLLLTILLVLITSIYLSVKLKWLQVFRLPYAFSLIGAKRGENKFSSVVALFTILGGNLGVGNISGTAVALKTGGPGSILWMAIVIVVTSIIKYVTCYLSMRTRKKKNGQFIGGPIACMADAFNSKKATVTFLAIMIVASITVGNLVQVNSLSIPLGMVNVPMVVGGVVMAIMFFAVVAFSFKKIKIFISAMIPIMTVSYLTLCSIILFKFSENVLPSLKLITSSFFTTSGFNSGLSLGLILEVLTIIQVGTLRGIFATDIGLGLEGIVHSSIIPKKNSNRFIIEQSLITIISPFVVAFIVFITAMVLLVTDSWVTDLESTNMCIFAFRRAMSYPCIDYLIIVIMFCFAFTTIFTWFFCAKQTIRYVSMNDKYIKIWIVIFTAIIPLGAISEVQLLWNIADISIAALLFINILAIFKLTFRSPEVFTMSNRYLKL